MRVLHLINAFNPGGIERWLLSMLREIPRHVAEMDVCCKGADTGPWAPEAAGLGTTIYHCPLRASHVQFVRGLSHILRHGKYDVVQNHLGLYSGCGTWVAKRLGVPVMVTFHNTEFRPTARSFQKPLLRMLRAWYGTISIGYALRKSDLIACVSQGVSDRIVAGRPDLMPKSRIMVHGVPVPELPSQEQRNAFRKCFGWSDDTPVVIHVGKFTEQKNHLGLLAVFEGILKRIPDAKLVSIGVGPLKDQVQSVIQEKGLVRSVQLLGQCDDALSLISMADLFLFPSLFEGFGLAALEANAVAVPVVGSRIQGLAQAIEDGRTGILHPPHDLEAMSRSAVKILTDSNYAAQLGSAGRIRVQRQFSTYQSATRLLELYQECVGIAQSLC